MVNPILLVAALLGAAFLYPLVEKLGRAAARIAALGTMAALTALVLSWLPRLAREGFIKSQTAGFSSPLSITLAIGFIEGVVLSLLFIVGFAGLVHLLFRRYEPWQGRRVVLFFIVMLGAAGMILTRDLFNLFVFMEISSLSLYGILATSRDERVFEGGFKYMIAGGLASAFFLIGTAFVYRAAGTLSLDEMIRARYLLAGSGGFLGLLLLLAGILIELKLAPVNGWALDTYEAADHGIGAVMSGINATAMMMVLLKILPLFSAQVSTPAVSALTLLPLAGGASFLISQFGALRQSSFKRMLGYSSTAHISMMLMAAGLYPLLNASGGTLASSLGGLLPAGSSTAALIVLLLLINHSLAKAGLFWLGSCLGSDASGGGTSLPERLRSRPLLLVLFGVFIFALLGLPPFPAFWAKWSLVMAMIQGRAFGMTGLVLLGSLLEAVYLLRFFTAAARNRRDNFDVVAEEVPADFADEKPIIEPGTLPPTTDTHLFAGGAPGVMAATLLSLTGGLCAWAAGVSVAILLPFAGLLLFGLIDAFRLPVKSSLILAGAGVALFGWYLAPRLSGLSLLFGMIFVGGSLVQLIAFLNRRGREPGLTPLLVTLILSLGALVVAASNLELFIAWETMTLASFLLILRGRRGSAGALRYILFSLLAAYLFFAGLGLLGEGNFITAVGGRPVAAILIALGLLIKLGTLGFHIWLPVSYAEAEDEVSSLIASVLSKAGLYLLFVGAGLFAGPLAIGLPLPVVLGWIGVATALAGSLMALFQEDIKYTLAYSSMGQIGYMVLTWAAMSHLGWIASLYLAITHLLFKAMLFLAVAGVIYRTRTRLMYQMGGLIKRMPLSFLSVLFAIIALSGVPPLSGFGAKWLMYSSLNEKGWYLQAALAMFASGVAFLYLFRLIHSIFLGQRKAIHHEIGEAPLWFIVPQFIFMALIMAISMFPNLLIKPLQQIIEPYFAATIAWEGYSVISSLGYWNGNAVMYVTMGVFIVPLLWLLLVKGRVYKVEQFNIVFAAERPYKPETTHYAYNFFGHYQKALGFLVEPWALRFWRGTAELGGQISGFLRRINTGNTQTYSLQIVLYLLLMVFILRGGV